MREEFTATQDLAISEFASLDQSGPQAFRPLLQPADRNLPNVESLGFPSIHLLSDSILFCCDEAPVPKVQVQQEKFGEIERKRWAEDKNDTVMLQTTDGTRLKVEFKPKSDDTIEINAADGTTYSLAADQTLTVTSPDGKKQTFKPDSTMVLRCGSTVYGYPPEAQFACKLGRNPSVEFGSGGSMFRLAYGENGATYSKVGTYSGGQYEKRLTGKGFTAPDGTTAIVAADGSMTVEANGVVLKIDPTGKQCKVTKGGKEVYSGPVEKYEGMEIYRDPKTGSTEVMFMRRQDKQMVDHKLVLGKDGYSYTKKVN